MICCFLKLFFASAYVFDVALPISRIFAELNNAPVHGGARVGVGGGRDEFVRSVGWRGGWVKNMAGVTAVKY